METPKFCYLDIETIPKGEKESIEYPLHPTLTDVKIGNRKGEVAEEYKRQRYPELVEAYKLKCDELETKADESYRKKALISTQSTIICIAYAFDDGSIEIISGSEKDILKQFESVLDTFEDKKYSISFVGHNVREFDIKRLYHRSFLYQCESLKNILKYMPKDRIIDTMELWSYHSYRDYTSLDEILKYLNLEGKGEIDGSKVYDYYIAGRLNEILEYCKDDVDRVRKLHKILN